MKKSTLVQIIKEEILRVIREADAGISPEALENIGFKFKSVKQPAKPGVILHEIITIELFNTPGDFNNINFQPFHLIFGDSSLAIFDAFGVNETAGLTRADAEKHIAKLKDQGKTEADGAYIAGLTNWAGKNVYLFLNAARCLADGGHYADRVIPHESLHMARILISLFSSEWIRKNQGEGEWYLDPRAAFEMMKDENEEFFAESLERISAITTDKWNKNKSKLEAAVDRKARVAAGQTELSFEGLLRKKPKI